MRITKHKPSGRRAPPVVELLESRMLFSADAMAGLAPFLQDDEYTEAEDALALNTSLVLRDSDGSQASSDEQFDAHVVADTSDALVNYQRLVIIDHSVPDVDTLVATLQSDGTRVLFIKAQEDGIQAVSDALTQVNNLTSIQIFSHGESGRLQLGSSLIDQQALSDHEGLISGWARAMADDADILLYGCNVAEGTDGELFVNSLARLSGADLAASTDVTGHSDKGGDWTLEYKVGQLNNEPSIDGSVQEHWNYSLAAITPDVFSDHFDIPIGTTLVELLDMQTNDGEIVSLREAVYASRFGGSSADTINLLAGDYILDRSSYDDSGLQGDLDVGDQLTVIGAGVGVTTIQNTAVDMRIFEVKNASSLTVVGVTMRNGDSGGAGGAISGLAGSTINLTDSEVVDSVSNQQGGGIYSLGSLILRNTDVLRNTAAADGGGIYASGALTIYDSTIERNTTANRGGGIYGTDITLDNVDIVDNEASNEGGGVYAQGNISVQNLSTVIQNRTDQDGGGVYAQGTYTINESEFRDNSSLADHGGAIYGSGIGSVAGSVFTQNFADKDGGGIYARADVTIVASYFDFNYSYSDGGAVYSQAGTEVQDSGFFRNSSDDRGGAIMARGFLYVERSSFDLNTAVLDKGGAIFHENAGELRVTNATFHENSSVAGGAIVTKLSGSITSSTFVANSASNEASAIWADGGNVTLDSSLFADNILNTLTSGVISAGVTTAGFNLFDYNQPGTLETDLNQADPRLDVMDRDGIVSAYKLTTDSPAVNAGKVEGPGATDSQGYLRDEISDIGASEVDSNASVVVWGDDDGKIYRSDIAFSNVQLVVDATVRPRGLAIDDVNARVYWMDFDTNDLNWASLDGIGGVSTLIPGWASPDAPRSIAIDTVAAHLYVTITGANPRIDRFDLNTGAFQATVVDTDISVPFDIEVSSELSRLYWGENGDATVTRSVRSSNLSGNDVTITPTNVVETVSVDASTVAGQDPFLYWSNLIDNTLSRQDLVSGDIETYATAPNTRPEGISFDEASERLVWSSNTTHNISTIGSDFQTIIDSYQHSALVVDIESMVTSTVSSPPEIATLAPLTVSENLSEVISQSQLSGTDADTLPADLVFSIVTPPSHGVLSVDSDPLATSFTQEQVNDGLVRYHHDGGEEFLDDIELVLSDSTHSSGSFRFEIVIEPVNDAPVLTAGTPVMINEGLEHVLTASDLSVADPDNVPADYRYHYESALVAGRLELNNAALLANAPFTHAQLLNGEVVYIHDGDEVFSESVDFVVSDGLAASNTATLDFTITPVNDAPVLTAGTPVMINEGLEHILTVSDLSVADPDNVPADYRYHYESALVAGRIELNNAPLLANAPFTHAQLLNGEVVYIHDGDEVFSESVDFVVSDGLAASNTATLDFTITPVNDAPVLTAGTPVMINEGLEHVLTASDLSVADPDNVPADYRYRYESALVAGRIELNNAALLANAPFTHAQLLNGEVVYIHDGDEVFSESVDFVVSDGLAASNTATLDFTITPVNDAPVLTAGTPVMINEGLEHVLTASDLSVADPDNVPADYRYRYESALVAGRIELNNAALLANAPFTHAQLLNGEVVYIHDGDEVFSESVDFVVSDGLAASNTATLDFTITPVNDAPVLTAGTPVMINEGLEHVLTASDLSVADPDNVPADYRYRYESALVAGRIELNNAALLANAPFTHAQLLNGEVVYIHDGDEVFSESVDFVVSDGLAASNTATLEFTITPVNDAPVLTIGTPVTVNEGLEHILTVSDLSVVDPDNVDTDYRYHYESALVAGRLELNNAPLLTNEPFTHAQLVNGEVVYIHDGDEVFAESVEFVVSDGLAASNTATLDFTITPVNDAPVLTAGTPVTVNEGLEHILTVSDLSVVDPDNVDTDYRYHYESALVAGRLELNNAPLLTNEPFTHAQLVNGEVVYIHDGDEVFSESVDFVVSDGLAAPNTATLDFTITPVNDAPVLTIGTPVTVNEGLEHILTVSDLSVVDPDNVDTDYRYHYESALVAGRLELNNAPLLTNEPFTHAQLVNGEVVYIHDGDEVFAESVEFVVSDGLAASNTATLDFTITPVNDAPVLTAGTPVTIMEGGTHQFTVSDLQVVDVDDNATEIRYTYVNELIAGVIEVNGVERGRGSTFSHDEMTAGQVVYRHLGDEVYQETINLSATDNAGASSTSIFTINVTNVNDPVVLLAREQTISLIEGGIHVFSESDLQAVDSDTVKDEITYRYVSTTQSGILYLGDRPLPVESSFSHTQLTSGELAYRHDGGESENEVIMFVASDGIADSAPMRLQISLQPVNDVPQILFSAIDIPENERGAIAGTLAIVDNDAGDSFELELDDDRFTVDQDQLKLKDDLSLDFEQEPAVELRLSVTDSAGAVSHEDVSLIVLDRNDSPELQMPPEVLREENYSLPDGLFTDSDGDTLTYSASLVDGGGLPVWLEFNEQERKFQVVDSAQLPSELDVIVYAQDGRGGESSVTVTLLFDPVLSSALPTLLTEPIDQVRLAPNNEAAQFLSEQTVSRNNQIIIAKSETLAVADEVLTSTLAADVDLHSLIKPLEVFASLEFASVGEQTIGPSAAKASVSIVNEVDSFDLAELLSLPQSEFIAFADNLSEAMDTTESHQLDKMKLSQALVGSSAGITTGLSVGYLIWLIRGGALMGSILSSLPAWRFVDPLPVLSALSDSTDDDDESLASMVETAPDELSAHQIPGDMGHPGNPDPGITRNSSVG